MLIEVTAIDTKFPDILSTLLYLKFVPSWYLTTSPTLIPVKSFPGLVKVVPAILTWLIPSICLLLRTVSAVLFTYLNSVQAGDKLEVVVLRDGKEITLKTDVVKIPIKKKNVFKMLDEATDEQLEMRQRWLDKQ